ncbi:MAG TPA: hypothetical protein DD636_07545 [Anaerolineaceae bacterium]|jgi:hypothetical protein|nr:hypothetical protein [Anaerolineaceae bacterium]
MDNEQHLYSNSNWIITYDEVSNQHFVAVAKDERGRTIERGGGHDPLLVISEVYYDILNMMSESQNYRPLFLEQEAKAEKSDSFHHLVINVQLKLF